jgi:antitoxin (DNA-binding transcriptional repressor) of toxin-antitoxin stability system
VKVATKRLKNELSAYLRLVRAGEHLEVTDRGEVIAEIRPAPPARSADARALEGLAAEGLVTRGRGRLESFDPIAPRKRRSVSRMIIEDRS